MIVTKKIGQRKENRERSSKFFNPRERQLTDINCLRFFFQCTFLYCIFQAIWRYCKLWRSLCCCLRLCSRQLLIHTYMNYLNLPKCNWKEIRMTSIRKSIVFVVTLHKSPPHIIQKRTMRHVYEFELSLKIRFRISNHNFHTFESLVATPVQKIDALLKLEEQHKGKLQIDAFYERQCTYCCIYSNFNHFLALRLNLEDVLNA